MMIFSRKNACVLATNRLVFGEDPDSFVLPRLFSRILYHYQAGRKVTFCSVCQQVD